jgi:hypothetical protein
LSIHTRTCAALLTLSKPDLSTSSVEPSPAATCGNVARALLRTGPAGASCARYSRCVHSRADFPSKSPSLHMHARVRQGSAASVLLLLFINSSCSTAAPAQAKPATRCSYRQEAATGPRFTCFLEVYGYGTLQPGQLKCCVILIEVVVAHTACQVRTLGTPMCKKPLCTLAIHCGMYDLCSRST